mgnify:CR=1 FL=1
MKEERKEREIRGKEEGRGGREAGIGRERRWERGSGILSHVDRVSILQQLLCEM